MKSKRFILRRPLWVERFRAVVLTEFSSQHMSFDIRGSYIKLAVLHLLSRI